MSVAQLFREQLSPRDVNTPVAQLLLEAFSSHFVMLLDGMKLGRGTVDSRRLKLLNAETAVMLVTLESEGTSPKV